MKEISSPMFSVVIPTWNRIDPLLRAIKSVIDQTLGDWEVIVIDDASDDQNTIIDAISSFKNRRIRTIPLQDRHNAAYARNIGIQNARGSWVCFLDSDDYFMPEKLSCIKEIIQSAAIDDKTIIYHQLLFKSDRNEEVLPVRVMKKDGKIGDYLFCNNGRIGTSGTVLHHNFALEIQFDPNCQKHQDYDLLLRAEDAGANFYFVKKALGVREYRKTGSHVGALHIPSYSCGWYNAHSHLLSKPAQVGFLYMHVLDTIVKKGRRQTVLDIFKILMEGNMPKKYFWLVLSTLLPYGWYQEMRNRKQVLALE